MRNASRSGAAAAPAPRGKSRNAPAGPPLLGRWGTGRRLVGLLAVLFVFGVFLRTYQLAADPPLRLSWSQSPVTDGANVVDAARDRVLTGRWVTDPRNPAFAHYPLSSLVAYASFRLFGVGLWQAALPSVVAGSLSLLVVAGLLLRHAGPTAAVLGLLFLGASYQQVMYDRLATSEALMISLMVFAAVLLVEALAAPRRRPWLLFAAGALVGLDGFFVKLHALLLAPVGALAIWSACRRAGSAAGGGGETSGEGGAGAPPPETDLRRSLAAFGGGVFALALLWVVAVFLPFRAAMTRFLQANVVGHYHYGEGDQGFWEALLIFLRKRTQGLFAFGVNVTFLFRAIFPAAVALLFLARFLYDPRRQLRTSRPLPLVLTLWLGLGIGALSLLDYRPDRYHMMLLPPLCALAALGLDEFLRAGARPWRPPPFRGRLRFLLPPIGFFIGYQCIGEGGRLLVFHSQAIYRFLTGLRLDGDQIMNSVGVLTQGFANPTLTALAIGLLVVVLYAAGARRLAARGGLVISPVRRETLVLLLATVALAWDMSYYTFSWASSVRHTVQDAGRDLGEILSPGAVLLGNTATTLCLENRWRTVPHYADIIRREEPSALAGYPITHILYRGARLRSFVEENFPEVKEAQVFVRSYDVFGETAELWRVPHWPGRAAGEPYLPSDFEQGISLLQENRFAEAAGRFEAFLRDHPENGNACIVLGACYSELGRSEETLAMFERAARLRPRDPAILQDLGDIYLQHGDRTRAEEVWTRALRIERDNQELARRLGQLRGRGLEGFVLEKPAGAPPGTPPAGEKPPFFEGDER